MKTFEEAWAEKEAAGYQYGSDALEQVRLGWEMRAAVESDSATEAVCGELNPALAEDPEGERPLRCGLPKGHEGLHEDERIVRKRRNRHT